MSSTLYTLYRSTLAQAKQQAMDTGEPVILAGGGSYGSAEDQVSILPADALWGTRVALVHPDGSLETQKPVRIIDDRILEAGIRHHNV